MKGHALADFEDFPLAPLLAAGNPRVYRQCIELQARARTYCRRHLAGRVDRWDQEAGQDHGFVPWPAIDASLAYGFLSLNLPGAFGGGDYGPTATAVLAEELASADAGVFVIFGAHGLALSLMLASLDLPMIARFAREITEGERSGRTVLLALAHTEPGGGSDVEDGADIQRARIGSRFQRVPGGYRVNARKVFISNGAIARYQVLTACGDPARPLQTMRGFVIPAGAPGLSIGRVERKLGQRLCGAAEVVCDHVFVPDRDTFATGSVGRAIDTTLSLTRGPVAAMSAGIIRGVIDRTLAYVDARGLRGQWVDLALADMLAALETARGLYLGAALAAESWGLPALAAALPRWPAPLRGSRLLAGALARPRLVDGARRLYQSRVGDDQLQRLVARSSIAKFVCSDLAVDVAMKAMEILGSDANDPRWGVEKLMRDAKLAQIFEGTNQINRLHATRGLVAEVGA